MVAEEQQGAAINVHALHPTQDAAATILNHCMIGGIIVLTVMLT
jgi:hypothetical protein